MDKRKALRIFQIIAGLMSLPESMRRHSTASPSWLPPACNALAGHVRIGWASNILFLAIGGWLTAADERYPNSLLYQPCPPLSARMRI